MANLLEEKKVEQSGIYAQKKLDELTPAVGDSIGFYLKETPTLTGDDGEFMVCNGLQLNLAQDSFEKIVASAEPVSFIARSILEKDIREGAWRIGQVARLESKIRRGDLYKGRKVKYFAWDVYIQNAPNTLLADLDKKITELKGTKPEEMTEEATTSTEPTKKPKL